MTWVKYWTINCSLLNDKEFEEFVRDIEAFIQTRKDGGRLAQKESELWLKHFIKEYSDWSDRKFTEMRYPLKNYFRIDTRIGSIENPRQNSQKKEQVA